LARIIISYLSSRATLFSRNVLGRGEACGDDPHKTREPRQRNEKERFRKQDVKPAQFSNDGEQPFTRVSLLQKVYSILHGT
jgi:hypothetical protein